MAHAIVFFARKFSYLFFYHYLCTDLASPVGLDWVKTSMDYAPKGMKGRFQNVIFNKIKLRKLDQPEDIATKRPRWVYYIRMSSTLWLVHIFYNTQWRGLAKLLISVEGQCEGLILWDRQRKFLPRLFCSKPYYIITADAGRSGSTKLMKRMKRNYLFYWFAVLLLLFTSVRSYAEVYSGSCGMNVNWTLNTESELLEFTGSGKMYSYNNTYFKIPWDIYKNQIKHCTIGEGITNIPDDAFSNCSNLIDVSLPNSITDIGHRAFTNCYNLTNIKLPNGLASIGYGAFYGCYNLKEISFPNTLTYIGEEAFYCCRSLKEIKIPNSIKNIGVLAFCGCTNLTNLSIPEGVTNIGNGAFYGCSKLKTIIFPSTLKCIDNSAFSCCTSLNEIIIPDKCETIASYAFEYCSNLFNITIPESVTYIGHGAFSNCSKLTNATIGSGVTSIENNVFENCVELTNITIPKTITSIGDYAFSGCTRLTNITIPVTVTNIGHYVFFGCSGLTSITIPETITSIGHHVFNNCTKLSNVIIRNGVTSIGNFAFKGCTALTNITIPQSVTSIGESAFQNCTKLTNISIPENITNIGYAAFENTSWFNNQPDGIIYIGTICYKYKGKTTNNISITIKKGTTSIANSAFENCTELTNITIPESVRSIGWSAFENCTRLTEVTIGNSIPCIGYRAFYGCSGLTRINIPNSVTSIGDEAFSNCSELTNITIHNNITSIGYGAFYGCENLKMVVNLSKLNITKGSSANGYVAYYADKVIKADTQINDFFFEDRTDGNYLVYYIGNETELTLPENYQGGSYGIGDYAFYKCTGLKSITIPNSVTSIGEYAFQYCSQLKTVINCSKLNITKGSSSYGYVAYYADKVIKPDTQIDDFFFEDRTDGNYLIYYIGDETELTLPENYQGGGYNVGESVFSNYSKLTNIIIPESVTSIGNYAFSGCSGLTSITIPNSATSIGDGAFKGCTGLTSITIPENVTSIGADAFCDCNNLTSIVWNVKSYPDPTSYEDSPFYDNIGTVQEIIFGEGITSIPKYLCKGMTNLKTVTFPQSLTSIRHYAFDGCTGLTEITLPENVDRIGPNALAGCTNIKTIYCRSQEPPVCGNSALDGIDTWDCTLFVPEGAESLYKAADQWKEFFFIEEITGIDTPKADDDKDTTYDIYDMSGRTVRKAATTTDGLKAGLYIINGRKVLVK